MLIPPFWLRDPAEVVSEHRFIEYRRTSLAGLLPGYAHEDVPFVLGIPMERVALRVLA